MESVICNNLCVICQQSDSRKIIQFEKKTLEKCMNIFSIRVVNNLKYNDIILPQTIKNSGYHRECYKSFTSIKKQYKQQTSESSDINEFSSSLSQPSTSITFQEDETDQSSVFDVSDDSQHASRPIDTESVCVFCNKNVKKIKNQRDMLHSMIKIETIQSSIQYMERLVGENILSVGNKTINSIEALNRLQNNSSQFYYHRSCYTNVNNAYESIVQKNIASVYSSNSWHKIREIHSLVLDKTVEFVKSHVGVEKKILFCNDLCKFYNEKLQVFCKEHNVTISEKTSQKIEQQIKQKISSDIITVITRNHKSIIIPTTTDNEDILEKLESFEEKKKSRQEAWRLRNIILSVEKHPLPEKFTIHDVIKGECTVPEELLNFIIDMATGPHRKEITSASFKLKAESLCQDLIYFVSRGRIKTSKHLTLGLTIKSKTNNKDVINILNKYGHCCSYSVLEGIETEAAYLASERSQLCPEDFKLQPNLCTGVAFDNFDRFVDTKSGKDTLHDTVGIIYQNIDDSLVPTVESENLHSQELDMSTVLISDELSTVIEKGKRHRRSYDAFIPEIVPRAKKIRQSEALLDKDDELRLSLPSDLQKIKQLDLIWMMSHALEIKNTPMWVGFNNLIIEDTSLRQKISYLNPINLPPKDEAVVIETMDRTLNIAKECKQKYIQCTYDLAITKIALEIQTKMHPVYENLFIHMGVFHIFLAYFKAIGKFIDNCGLTHMMSECNILASGSVNTFITGKNYKRGNRLHQINSLALQVLHFKEFCQEENLVIEDDAGIIETLKEFQTKKNLFLLIEDEYLLDVLKKYSTYMKKTLHGLHGKTAQYYAIYINLINHYLVLQRSVRTGNFELFKYILPKITNLFFIFNQPNYSRWLVKYHDNLLQIDKTHPGLKATFEQGYFGIKRTNKDFSRQAIDLTLEQTYNADAPRSLSHSMHSTNAIGARQRWAQTHGFRTSIVSHTLNKTNVKQKEDITNDLKESEIKKNCIDLKSMHDILKENINPFNAELDKTRLYNIASGVPVSDEIANFILNVEIKGDDLRKTFISDVAESKRTFYQPLTKNKILNFTNATKKKIIKINNKEQEIIMQRDLFGRMVGLSLQENLHGDKIDVEGIFAYPLTPIPLSMCHMDGAIHKTSKSVLLNELEQKVDSTSGPSTVDIQIIDGFFLLHLMKNIPVRYSQLAKNFLIYLTKLNTTRIDIVFDQHFSPSIKDHERARRDGYEGRTYKITEDMIRPSNFHDELKNFNFKNALVEFFLIFWAKDEMVEFIGSKILNVNYKYCDTFKVVNDKVIKSRNSSLSCPDHEEADTKIVYHVCQIENQCNVLLKCNDTDILIIMLGNMDQLMNDELKIWIETGTGNNVRHINVTKLYKCLGNLVSKALPAFHALTGCDYNASFYNKGKKRPLKILLESPRIQKACCQLSLTDLCQVEKKIFPILEEYVCEIYNRKKIKTVNQARYEKFKETYVPKKIDKAFRRKIRNFDASSLPPSRDELYQHLYRTFYIASIWSNAHMKEPTYLTPTECGWKENDEENKLEFVWFTGKQFPDSIQEIIQTSDCEENLSDDDDINDRDLCNDETDEEIESGDEDGCIDEI